MERSALEIWWDRMVEQGRKDILPVYPMPWDGASFAVMSNFFSVVGFGDDRPSHSGKLNALTWLAKPIIMDRFLELWPKIKPTLPVPEVKVDDEPDA